MTRTLHSSWVTQATAASSQPIQLAEMVFKSQTLRLCTGVGDVTWNGQTWIGNGWFEPTDGLLETEEFTEDSVEIRLIGVPAATASLVLQEGKHGATVKVWLGFLDSNGAVITDPAPIIPVAYFDYAEIDEMAEGADVRLMYKNFFLDLDKTREYRWNSESQKLFFPGDRGFEYVEGLSKRKLWWGPKKEDIERRKRKRTKNRKGEGSRKKKR